MPSRCGLAGVRYRPRRRCRGPCRGRRSAARGCRRRPRPSRPRAPRTAAPKRPDERRGRARRLGVRLEAMAVPMSSASSRMSSVSTGGASISKCAMISEPSASRSTSLPRRRWSAGMSVASAASSRSSGRMPRTTVAPDVPLAAPDGARAPRAPASGAARRRSTAEPPSPLLHRRLDHVHRRDCR